MADKDDTPEIRIDLPVDAHLPTDYVEDQAARIEAYRRLASATTEEEVHDVAVEWKDRYGEIPDSAQVLLDVASLRADAIRVGLTDIVKLKNEIRLSPVDLTDSQEVRLRRLERASVLRPEEGVLFIPAGDAASMVSRLRSFIASMWPPGD